MISFSDASKKVPYRAVFFLFSSSFAQVLSYELINDQKFRVKFFLHMQKWNKDLWLTCVYGRKRGFLSLSLALFFFFGYSHSEE